MLLFVLKQLRAVIELLEMAALVGQLRELLEDLNFFM